MYIIFWEVRVELCNFVFNKYSVSFPNGILLTFYVKQNGSKGKIPNFFAKITQRNYRWNRIHIPKKHRTLFSKGDINFMFHFLKGKSKENVLYAPCKGKVVPLSEVPDPTFSEKSWGRIRSNSVGRKNLCTDRRWNSHGIWYSSCHHAHKQLRNRNPDPHRPGYGYTKGRTVYRTRCSRRSGQKGDLLMDVDLDKITGAGLNTVTPVLICNTDDYEKISLKKRAKFP